MNIPNFFLFGAPKCGTTALYEYLRTHPNVFLPHVKEPHFFADDFPNYRDIDCQKTYLELFRSCRSYHKAIGEASVLYLCSSVAHENIYRFNKKAKIIVMVRNPVDMFHSLHSQLLYTFYENEKDYKKAWRLQSDRKKGLKIPKTCREPSLLQYKKICMLGDQVERLLLTFPHEQVKIILFEDFKDSTQAVYEDVLAFLELLSDNRSYFPRVNTSKDHRIKWLGRLLISPPSPIQKVRSSLKNEFAVNYTGVQKAIILFGKSLIRFNIKKTKRKAMPAGFRREIVNVFREDINKLSKILKKDLSSWTNSTHIYQ
jgi:hypothetical protein